VAHAKAGKSTHSDAPPPDRDVVITRLFDAPRERIWAAWTDPEQIVKWWGPRGFSLTIHEMDVRPGGVWRSTMHGPDGTDYLNDCVFTEVVPPARIAYRLTGGTTEARDTDALVSWTFEPLGRKTRLTLRMTFATPEARDHAARTYRVLEGGQETLGRLEEHLASGTAQ